MRWPTVVVGAVIASVLLPMWFVAIQGAPAAEPVELDHDVSEIQPLEGFVDAPIALSPSQVGVIVWVALFGLLGVLVPAHWFMNEAVRPSEEGPAPADEEAVDGNADVGAPGWLSASDRLIVEYREAPETVGGLVVMAVLTALTVAFSALFTAEYVALARTQYFGTYAAGMFLSLAALTVAYYAWFLPHVEVAEHRGHS